MGGQAESTRPTEDAAEKVRGGTSSDLTRRGLLALSALGIAAAGQRAALAASPEGQLTWAVHISLAPTWFDPAETPGMITPFLLLYALHDAMVKPMPGNAAEPCLAEVLEDGAGRAQLRVHRARRARSSTTARR